ncbi:hypothetical protein OSSY52_03770 [Tepiditoga spiralis]|uniref:Uncharacterized protein n=1 Tax=Tepiditoga spiralis TaxID=2108365 RepID=A0A7G1G4S8_9BACT|nr:hypothetical protein [Tepiditoga spiralis]BBE30236.1 hypothetical protein OSSY52_03770 [Tepiditoga spiralis]
MELKCEYCKKELLKKGTLSFYGKKDTRTVSEIRVTHTGTCDKSMEEKMVKNNFINLGNLGLNEFYDKDKVFITLLDILERVVVSGLKIEVQAFNKLREIVEFLNH